MLMLIPLSLVTSIVVVFLVMAQGEAAGAFQTQTNASARSVAFHHHQALQRVEGGGAIPNGLLALPAPMPFSAIEGLDSFVHRQGNTIFVMTWPRHLTNTHDRPPANGIGTAQYDERFIRVSLRVAGNTLSNARGLPGNTTEGILMRPSGGFSAQIGGTPIPFSPPVPTGTPVILTILSE